MDPSKTKPNPTHMIDWLIDLITPKYVIYIDTPCLRLCVFIYAKNVYITCELTDIS